MSGHMPWRKIDIWLQGYRSIWLSTTRPDGRPHCVPMWYLWLENEKQVYVSTHVSAAKVANLTHQPYAVLAAGNADDTILLEGTAHLVTDPAELDRMNGLWMQKYVDPYSGAQATVTGPDSRLYRIEIHHIMAWEYGAIATRTDWYFD